MGLNVLTLPVDIPWKRLCVSGDMNDGALCDARFPPRWRSSIAIFSYQPPDEDQMYENMVVSYLKVSCTVTGYQAGRGEVGLELCHDPCVNMVVGVFAMRPVGR